MKLNGHGIIIEGKFTGQPQYAPYFWKQVEDGLADARQGKAYIFDIQSKDIELFPELKHYDIVKVYKDRQGYISAEAEFE